MKEVIPKGTCIPFTQLNVDGTRAFDCDGRVTHQLCSFIPTWANGGVFSFDDCHRTRNNHTYETSGPRKRQRKECAVGKLELLVSNEVRQCDVCGDYVLWTPSMERQHFPSHLSTSKISSNDLSIANSLPHFVDRHISSQCPLPCSLCCTRDGESNAQLQYPWCGTLFCSKECQVRGESALEQTTTTNTIFLPPPKLFFCRNRLIDDNKDPEDRTELTRDCTQSLHAVERRLRDICGDQTLDGKECALVLAIMISCSCPLWIQLLKPNPTLNHNDNQSADKESLVEEMWVMSRSYWSLQTLTQQQPVPSMDAQSKSEFPSYAEFVQLFLQIKRYCLIRVNAQTHPVVSYATKTLISSSELTEAERDQALDVLRLPTTPKTCEGLESINNRMTSTIEQWRRATHFAHWIISPISSTELTDYELHSVKSSTESFASLDDDENKHIKLKSYFAFHPSAFAQLQHSCVPTLALGMEKQDKGTADKRDSLDILNWLVLHDVANGQGTVSRLDSLDDDFQSRDDELKLLMGQDFLCPCIRCLYERGSYTTVCREQQPSLKYTWQQMKRMGDLAMQQSRFQDAAQLYQSILDVHPTNGDVAHARAAAFLGRASSSPFHQQGHCGGYFLKAQRLWNEAAATKECASHPDIAVQLEKQRAYGTLNDNGEAESKDFDNIDFASYLNGNVYITNDDTPMISQTECQNVINIAEQHAARLGWTTTRHYAVPTTDVPLHQLIELRPWFYKLWTSRLRPTLRRQFRISTNTNETATVTSPTSHRDIFIHDVFVVRYDAQGGQRGLPPHYDESTHSFVIGLNTEYQGGGTFIHALGRPLKPKVEGGMLSFSGGEFLHSGDPVVEGIRYIIVGFCYVDLIGTKMESKNDKETKQPKLNSVFGESKNKSKEKGATRQCFSFGFDL